MNKKLFLRRREELSLEDHIVVRYRFQTPADFTEAAIDLSREQSFSCHEDQDKERALIQRFAAKVIEDSVLEVSRDEKPAIPSQIYSEKDGPFYTREVDLAFPLELFGQSLVLLYDTVIGEVHNIAKFTGLQVVDIDFPESWRQLYGGPVFGIKGIRNIVGKEKGPLLISPVKPCVGLTPLEFAARVESCLLGGFDGVKDDELLLDPPYCPFEERVLETVKAVKKVQDKTGQNKIYFAHVGGDINSLERLTEFALKNGASGIMYSPFVNGLDIIRRYKGEIPIIAHNNLTYAMCAHPLAGISFKLMAKTQRLIGADMMICPAPDRSFYVMDKETHRSNVEACVQESSIKKMLPGLSGSQTPETLYQQYTFLGHDNFAICPGAAVYEHPLGIEAGAKSFVEAVEAINAGIPLNEYAKEHPALKKSLQYFKKNKM